MAKKLALSEDDYLQIEKKCGVTDTECYAVTYAKIRTKMIRTIHVFQRKPDSRELTKYENEASKMRIKGNRAEIEGGAVPAATTLYKVIIDRVYDLPVARKVMEGPLSREQAISLVDPLTKRAALRDLVGEVWSASQIADEEGQDPDTEGHTVPGDE